MIHDSDRDIVLPGTDTECYELTRPRTSRWNAPVPTTPAPVRPKRRKKQRMRRNVATVTEQMQRHGYATLDRLGITTAEWSDLTARPLRRAPHLVTKRCHIARELMKPDPKTGFVPSFPQLAAFMNSPTHSSAARWATLEIRQ